MSTAQMFLLSPAYCAGRRAKILLNPASPADLAVRLREGTLTLGEAFSFMSGLYFRGKLTYALRFGRGSRELPPVLVITPTRGLQPPDLTVTADLIREFAAVDISADDPRYHLPLERDVNALAARLPPGARAVLHQLSGTWEAETSWSATAVVSTASGEKFRSTLSWK